MDRKGYDFLVQDELYYTFISSGKNGDIAKIVIFQELGNKIFNLVLADFDFDKETFSDTAVSNNGDLSKILATVLAIILDFFRSKQNACIIMEANSTPKNKLYNRMVKNYYSTLKSKLRILIETENGLEEYSIDKESNKFYLYTRQT